MAKASTPHDFEYLIDLLKEPKMVAEYLSDALAEGNMELFKQALDNVAKAKGGYTQLAETTGLNRQSLYRSLSKDGDPKLSTLAKILPAFGVNITLKVA